MNIEEQLEARIGFNLAADYESFCNLCDMADALIGTMTFEGEKVSYIKLRDKNGNLTDTIKVGDYGELCIYLIENRYVWE
jgi:hypothetical protein